MIRSVTSVTAIGLAIVLSACAQPTTPTQPGGAAGASAVTVAPTTASGGPVATPSLIPTSGGLDDTEWALGAVIGTKKVAFPAEGGKAVIRIGDGQVSGQTGCNTFLGKITFTDAGALSITSLQSHKDPCKTAALADQNQAMLTILKDATGYKIEGTVLTVTAAPDAAALKFAKALLG